MARFGRVITAMVTPFDDKGALDLDAAANLADWLVENGSDGLVLCGTTGESPVLTDSEEVALPGRSATPCRSRCSLGTGSNDTAYAVEATRRAADAGRRRRPGRHAVLQPPVPGRPRRPLPRRRRRHRAAGRPLRHPDPHRPQDRHRRMLIRLVTRCRTSSRSRTRRRPGRTARLVAAAARRLRALQRRRRVDPAAARDRRRRRHLRGEPLGRPPDGRDGRRVREGRRRDGRRDQRRSARPVLRLRGRRRRPEPDPDQGHPAGAGAARWDSAGRRWARRPTDSKTGPAPCSTDLSLMS